MLVAAALCPAPPLLAGELTGADPVLPELRAACADAVAAAVASGPDLVAVAGAAEVSRAWDPRGRLDVTAFAPALGRRAPAPPAALTLPLSLGLGARLLDESGYTGERMLVSVTEDDPPEGCAALGRRLSAAAGRVALLAMADGGARRSARAPGYLDERTAAFDAQVAAAVRSGDLAALLAVDPGLARELMAAGRPAWQVLAGAAAGLRVTSEVRYASDPFGTWYLVASLNTNAT